MIIDQPPISKQAPMTKQVPMTDQASADHRPLQILYQDEALIAIYKPEGLLVHRSPIDKHETRFALQQTRDQIGQHVYPVHRLDKPTSGVLLFALSPDYARALQQQFEQQTIAKEYLSIVRGYTPVSGVIDHPLVPKNDFKSKRGKEREAKPAQAALTHFTRLATLELEAEVDRYPFSRYSLVKAMPKTGRKHQIRRHFKHLSHPIIGCPKYGKSKHNRYFSSELDCPRLLLHCQAMQFLHPGNGELLRIEAEPQDAFLRLIDTLNWHYDPSSETEPCA